MSGRDSFQPADANLPAPVATSASATRTEHSSNPSSNTGFVVKSRPLASSPTGQDWIHLDPHQPLTTSPTQADFSKSARRGQDHPEITTNLSALARPTLNRSPSSQLRSPEEDLPDIGVVDTNRIRLTYDAEGRRMVNQYVRVESLGRGTHGRVWLCEEIDPSTGNPIGQYAIKEVYREDQSRNLKKAQRAMHGTSFNHVPEAAWNQNNNNSSSSVKASDPGPSSSSSATQTQQQQQQQSGSSTLYQSEQAGHPKPTSLPRSNGRISDLADADPLDGRPAGQHVAKAKRSGVQMEEKVRQEIAIMKRCRHKHIVQLREVINDPKSKKIFMVLEYLAGGQVEYTSRHTPGQPIMTVDKARQTIRDVILGVEYLHYQGIIHRDIKPANLLWTDESQSCLKITDFGVSHLSEALAHDGQASPTEGDLRKTAGSPAFFAPELCFSADYSPLQTPHSTGTPVGPYGLDMNNYFASVNFDERGQAKRPGPNPFNSGRGRSSGTITTVSHPLSKTPDPPMSKKKTPPPPIGKAIDIWAVGVTLYCLLFGTTPFQAETEYMLYNIIPNVEAPIPDHMGSDRVAMDSEEGKEAIDLLGRLLEKDPTRRASLAEVKTHPWILRKLANPQEWVDSTDPSSAPAVTVTNEEVQHATVARARGLRRSVWAAGSWSSWRRGTSKLVSAVGLGGAKTQRQPSVSSMSASGDNRAARSFASSRQASGSSHGGRAPSPNQAQDQHGRRWSIKRKVAASASVPTTPLLTGQALDRRDSVSSSASNPSSPAVDTRRLSGQSVPPASSGSMQPIPMAIRRTSSHLDPTSRSQQGSYPPGISTSHSDAESNGKLSLRHMWDKLVNVGRSQTNSPARPRGSNEPRGRQRSDDTDISAAETHSIAESDARSVPESAPSVLPTRSDFDSLGRKQRPVQQEEEEEEYPSDEDVSDSDTDSSLGEPIDGNFTFNNGYGWSGSGSACDDPEMSPKCRSPAAAASTSASGHPESTPHTLAPLIPGLPGTRDGSPSGMVCRDVAATIAESRRGSTTSSQAADTSSDLDIEEEEAALELNFGRRRRQTNPGDMSSSAA